MWPLQTRMLEEEILYDGSQLRPHWIYETTEMLGDSLVAFAGPARVELTHMVDREDVRANAPIASPRMVHFLGEWFLDSLETGVLLQHLFICEAYEWLLEAGVGSLRRRGNDVYFEDRKLSVSIATRSPVSVLMHAGFNVTTKGTPIPTSGLQEIGVDERRFAIEVLDRFAADSRVWKAARVKVSPR